MADKWSAYTDDWSTPAQTGKNSNTILVRNDKEAEELLKTESYTIKYNADNQQSSYKPKLKLLKKAAPFPTPHKLTDYSSSPSSTNTDDFRRRQKKYEQMRQEIFQEDKKDSK